EARDAVLMILGVIPAFLVAALIEGFVTGRTGSPVVEVAIGALVAAAYLALLLRPVRRVADQDGGTIRGGPST
ncbi:MAG TPA: stage II sporulation protein M, partial [Actinomycetota bacterium]|nr:stage II sporulation protein M [Actinomycetota bacterium]